MASLSWLEKFDDVMLGLRHEEAAQNVYLIIAYLFFYIFINELDIWSGVEKCTEFNENINSVSLPPRIYVAVFILGVGYIFHQGHMGLYSY